MMISQVTTHQYTVLVCNCRIKHGLGAVISARAFESLRLNGATCSLVARRPYRISGPVSAQMAQIMQIMERRRRVQTRAGTTWLGSLSCIGPLHSTTVLSAAADWTAHINGLYEIYVGSCPSLKHFYGTRPRRQERLRGSCHERQSHHRRCPISVTTTPTIFSRLPSLLLFFSLSGQKSFVVASSSSG